MLNSGTNEQVALQLLRESQFSIEWTAPDASEDAKMSLAKLVELQRLLSYWHYHWSSLWFDLEQRKSIAHQAQEWSHRLLDYSGLLS